MLQRSNTESAIDSALPDSPEQGGLGELVDFAFGFLRRQYPIILFLTVIVLGAGGIYLAVTPPTYTAQARISLGSQRSQFVQQQSIYAEGPFDSAQMETQLQILQSKGIASSVVEKLMLVDDPEFGLSSESADGGLSELVRDLLRRVRGVLSDSSDSNAPKQVRDPKEVAIAALASRLTVNRIGNSHVIEIGFSSRDPKNAARIANAVADAFIVDQLDAKYQANRTAATWLQERQQKLAEQSSAAERAVLAFRQEHDIVAASGKLMDDQQVSDLSSRLVAARTQTSDLLARLDRIESIIEGGANLDATVSDVLTSSILTNLRQQYLELSRRESEYSIRYGRDHLSVVNIKNRMRELRSSTFDELRRLAETYKSDYEIAKKRQEEIEKQLASAVSQSRTTNQAQVALNELESAAKGYRTLYETFQQRSMASVQQESFPVADARLISAASTPTSKSKPKTPLILALALAGGLGLGMGLGLLRDLMDRVFRTGAQFQAILQTPCLALVPLLKGKELNELRREPEAGDEALGPRMITRDSSAFWKVVEAPFSPFAESIRSIKLAVNLNITNRPNKVIGFTSALPNEGKSTNAAALAQLTAQVGSRVILVDCDLRNPSLSRTLAPKATIGIVDVIAGERSLEEAIWRDPVTNLFVLPAVKKTPFFDTSALLGAEATKKLFDKLAADFDYVVVDLPPLAPIVDVRAVTHIVDCMILVVEWGRTKIDVVQHALNTAPNVREALIGAVLNKTNMDCMRRYDAHRGSLYDNKDFSRYGYADVK